MNSEGLPPILSPLTAAERHDLLWLARQSIAAALRGAQPPAPRLHTLALSEPAAAFVSLHQERRLRGCVGTLVAERPLHETVVRMARASALEDPRFLPLSAVELESVDIEISRLGPLVPARPEQICPGQHGVCVSCGERRGVFLPQVAALNGWDRETLLREVCRKAMLDPQAWKNPDTSLMMFAAEVFGEHAAAADDAPPGLSRGS